MVIFERVSQDPYKIKLKLGKVSLVANAESVVRPEMIVDHTRMSEEFRNYIRPLLEGEVKLVTKDGVALMANFKKVLVK